MDPIGASSTWRWFGYENSWVLIDGQPVQSVTGGGPLGRRHVHQRVRHGAVRLSHAAPRQMGGSPAALRGMGATMALTPDAGRAEVRIHELVPEHRPESCWPSAPATTFIHVGNGTNIIYRRSRPRSRRGGALDRQQGGRRLRRSGCWRRSTDGSLFAAGWRGSSAGCGWPPSRPTMQGRTFVPADPLLTVDGTEGWPSGLRQRS